MAAPDNPVRISVDPAAHAELVTGDLVLKTRDGPLALALTVPAGETTTEAILPVLHELSNLFCGRAVKRAEAAGAEISCRAGCGACCRQLVPVARAEARQIAALVAAMPQPRQSAVRARFAEALAEVEAAELSGAIRDPARAGTTEIGMAYFRLGSPCPFLEDEACSIHPDRPLSCREFLVTSPPENCSDPAPGRIDALDLEWRLSHGLIRSDHGGGGWVPLILALETAAEAAPPTAPGPDILRGVITAIMN